MTLASPAIHAAVPSQIRPQIHALQSELVAWRRSLHQYPELGFREHRTAAFVQQRLQDWRIAHETGIAGTGIVATLKGHQSGPVLAIRADMDALPVLEENLVPYRSLQEGVMHACGHDGHTAIALGTAYYLSQNAHSFCGTVKIIFQPAEEGPGGAAPMIEAGVLDYPAVDAIIGLHLWNNLPLGTVGIRSGPLMAAVELFDCDIQGRGGHGALPQQTVDSIVVAAQIVGALQTIVARSINPLDAAVVTVGSFHGGHTHNVIADTTALSGTVRYFNPALADLIPQRFEQIVAGICQSYGASYSLNYRKLYPPVVNNEAIAALIQSVAASVVETPIGITSDCQTMGGEDMSYFLEKVPGCYFFLGSANDALGLNFPHHHPRFDFDETALGIGVEIFVRCVEKFCRV